MLVVVASACGIARPIPAVAPDPSGAEQRVLIVGDSLSSEGADALARAFADASLDGELHNWAQGGSGLLSDWPFGDPPYDHLDAGIQATDPTIIVLEYSGNHFGASGIEWGSEEFFEQWWSEYQRLVDLALASGAAVYVVKTPPFLQSMPQVREELALGIPDFVAANPGVGMIDWWGAWQADGCVVVFGGALVASCFAYALYTVEDGAVRRVRHDDGIHGTLEGNGRVALATVGALRHHWPESP